MMADKKIHYQISGAGVLYIDSDEFLQSPEGKKQIELLKQLQEAVNKKKQARPGREPTTP